MERFLQEVFICFCIISGIMLFVYLLPFIVRYLIAALIIVIGYRCIRLLFGYWNKWRQ